MNPSKKTEKVYMPNRGIEHGIEIGFNIRT